MSEIIEALNQLEKERNISKDVLLEAIERSLKTACKKDFNTDENITVSLDRETGECHVYAAKEVVEEVENPACQITLEQAKMISSKYEIGDTVNIEITTKNFGRIAAQRARNVIVQAINENERAAIYDHFHMKEKDIVTGIVQRQVGDSVNVSLDDKTEALLKPSEMIEGESYERGDRIKLYITEVKKTNRGPRITVSRTHPELVKRLFEKEVTEIADGTVETSDDIVIGGKKSVQEFDDEARADLQSIRDLISRYNRLDAAILLANATTDIEVAGVTMTRAAAINLRKTLLGRSFSNTNFDDALIRKINNDFTKAKMAINKSQENADRQKEAMSTALASSDKKVLSDDSLKSISAYCDNLVYSMVDPIDAEKVVGDLQGRQDELKANLESAIRISNATTYVEF